ncbi:periphilin-1 isoform X2 [Fukomys damarensis]|uniref:periphilin-1 isoform X2 n=1 Tax=Fukomys damarensis TaxID=885580 RepID=UPI00053FE71D|nr:periphilin-1 isoform X2 [Fukomys damarensis]
MWSEGRYNYESLPTEQVPPQTDPSDGYHGVVNIVPQKPPLLDRPGEESYSRYHSHVGYQEYVQGCSFSHDRRSGPPHGGDESGYRWSRDDHSSRQQTDYRDTRDDFGSESFYSFHCIRDRSPHKRDAPFFQESSVGQKDSPHSRSGSSVSSRSYSPDRSKTYSFHESQQRNEERLVQPLKPSRDTSPSSSSAGPSSKVLDKPSRLTEKEFAEATSRWAAEKLQKSEENSSPGFSEFQAFFGFLQRLCIPTMCNESGSNPLLELQKLAIQLPPGTSRKRKRMGPLPSTTHASGPTWGDIKKLTNQAEQTLQITGTPSTPENLFLATIAHITSNSKAAQS